MQPPKRPPSLRNIGGVAEVLEHVKENMQKRVLDKLSKRIATSQSNLSPEEAETISRIAAQIAREECANAVAEAYQSGINTTAKQEDFERDTLQPTKDKNERSHG